MPDTPQKGDVRLPHVSLKRISNKLQATAINTYHQASYQVHRQRLQAEAEARMRAEWNETDAKTQKMLDKSRNPTGRGGRLRRMLSNRRSEATTPPDPELPPPDNSGG